MGTVIVGINCIMIAPDKAIQMIHLSANEVIAPD